MRARNIKPGFFKNELLGTSDPLLSLLFAGLWCLADRNGVLEDRPLRIKAEIFPYRELLDIHRELTVLSRMGFIIRYKKDDSNYIQICKFSDHQHPHHTEKESGFPVFSDGCELTGNSPVNNGDTPSDLLIPDSLIPDLLIPEVPPISPPGGEVIPFGEIIDYLNEKIGGAYKSTTTATQRLIRARWGEGFRLEDFMAVIDNKTAAWLDDDKMKEYLRPATLFSASKFEGYLNHTPETDKQPEISPAEDANTKEWIAIISRTQQPKEQ